MVTLSLLETVAMVTLSLLETVAMVTLSLLETVALLEDLHVSQKTVGSNLGDQKDLEKGNVNQPPLKSIFRIPNRVPTFLLYSGWMQKGFRKTNPNPGDKRRHC